MSDIGERILKHVREMGVENMWEDRKIPNCVSTLHGLLPATKENYPPNSYVGKGSRRGSCDVVFDGNWIEVKFAWTYKDIEPYSSPNPSYKKHLLGDVESALRDVQVKLASLAGNPDVKRVALLLVCLYSPSRPISIDTLEELGGLRADGWVRSDLPPWPNPRNAGCSICAYLWERANPMVIPAP